MTIQQRDARIEQLQEQVRLLLARRFGASSEKLPDGQLGLFNEAEVAAAEEPEADAATEVAAHRRARPAPQSTQRVHHSGRTLQQSRKNSVLFLKLLDHLRRQYRRAKRIVLILDNYCIHASRVTQRWLAKNPKFQLLFQPTYHPWVNVIERLWKAMHDTVTRNHRCRSMYELCQSVARFLEVVQPFPGNGHGVAHLRSAI